MYSTINSFVKRWNKHRNIWKNYIVETNHERKNQFALVIHYKKIPRKTITKQTE